ncbi:hypothetical protein DAEQUDRAFT_723572 [Daedalea quercina L-15889]|uniref:Nudix hydrolase domain-containing protein n=1 Tax=Daedalea quercina L-15889 TaxID=1314783 RepID=A0A165SGL1_9APHY|nr:hypothetical protein DAEQUDRAFT_723572 [Daedalea quercina L-15889]
MLRTLTTTATTGSSARIPITSPLSRTSLSIIKSTLASTFEDSDVITGESHAAVLIPLCNVDNKPGVLLEVRGKLRTHSGEVSFPGGRVDEIDASPLAAALRETQEELGIQPRQVEILGRIGPPETSLSGLRVWPYIGFVHAEPHAGPSEEVPVHVPDVDMPLPSLSLSKLRLSPAEVAHAFHLPMSALISPPRLHSYLFRAARPYFAVSVADFAGGPDAIHSGPDATPIWINDAQQRDEIGGGREGRLEVWGLTGWYLSELMRRLGIYSDKASTY